MSIQTQSKREVEALRTEKVGIPLEDYALEKIHKRLDENVGRGCSWQTYSIERERVESVREKSNYSVISKREPRTLS
jgi:hypothetical protein